MRLIVTLVLGSALGAGLFGRRAGALKALRCRHGDGRA